MVSRQFDEWLARIGDFGRAGDFGAALQTARDLKTTLLNEEAPDPEQVGSAHYYEFFALARLEDWQAVFQLLSTTAPYTYVMSAKNDAWMNSVGAEAAVHLNLSPSVVAEYVERAVAHRLRDGDQAGAALAHQTACALLSKLSAHVELVPFARRLYDAGADLNEPIYQLRAVRFLLRAYEEQSHPLVSSALHACVDHLKRDPLTGQAAERRAVLANYDRMFN